MRLLSTLFTAILLSFPLWGQVSFTYNLPSGCAPLSVQFTNTSTQGNYYEWSIGNKQYSEENPTVTLGPGYYFPNLTVWDTTGGGMNYIGWYNSQLILKGLEIQGVPETEELCVGQPFSPYAYTSGFNEWVPVKNVSWDFGDGATSTEEYPSHAYSGIGTYTLRLTATTDSCGTQVLEREIRVVDQFTFQSWTGINGPSIACPNTLLDFYVSMDVTPQSIIYNYGDGTIDTIYNEAMWSEHSYSNTGNYTVNAKIISYCGNDTTVSAMVYIGNDVPVSNVWGISAPARICPGAEIDFWVLMSNRNSHTYAWDFGDGNTSQKEGPSHLYNMPGSYNVSVTVTNACGNDTTVFTTVEVKDNLHITDVHGISGTESACPGDGMDFWVGVSYGETYSYEWNFGDGNTSVSQSPEHVYTTAGTYNVSVKITNKCGMDTTVSTTVDVVTDLRIDYAEIYVPSGICPGDQAEFYAITDNGSTYDYAWDFGDGNSATSRYPRHSFADTGTYNVSVKITNGCGNDTTLSKMVKVGGNLPLSTSDIDFDHAGYSRYCPGDLVTFFHYMGNMDVSIDFGDGTAPTTDFVEIEIEEEYFIPIITHTYSAPGTYTVTLTATNGCGSTASNTLEVEIGNGVEAEIDISWTDSTGNSSIITCEPVYFYPEAQGGEVAWDFGDGNTAKSKEIRVKHVYVNPGTYMVKATVTNGCGQTATESIEVVVTGDSCKRVGIIESATSLAFDIYPNPASSSVTVALERTQFAKVQVELYNMTGKMMHQTLLTSSQAEINLSGFAPGVYLLKINADGRQAVRKVVIK
ncbi:MAG: PKD domain-containing protein [Bacteroidia bacterium]